MSEAKIDRAKVEAVVERANQIAEKQIDHERWEQEHPEITMDRYYQSYSDGAAIQLNRDTGEIELETWSWYGNRCSRFGSNYLSCDGWYEEEVCMTTYTVDEIIRWAEAAIAEWELFAKPFRAAWDKLTDIYPDMDAEDVEDMLGLEDTTLWYDGIEYPDDEKERKHILDIMNKAIANAK